jgi:hypothetical protein
MCAVGRPVTVAADRDVAATARESSAFRPSDTGPCPLVSLSHPLAVSAYAFARIRFEVWYGERILIASESGLCGAQPHSRHVVYARTPHAKLDGTLLEQMRNWLL